MTNPATNIPDKPTLDGIEERWAAQWDAEGTYRFDASAHHEARSMQVLEKDIPDDRQPLLSKDVKKYFQNAQKIIEDLNKFYEQCRDVYTTPITRPAFWDPNPDNPVIEATIEADRQLRIFAIDPVSDEPSFSQLFPPLEEILPQEQDGELLS